MHMSISNQAREGEAWEGESFGRSSRSSWVEALEEKALSWEVLLGESLGVKTLIVETLIWDFSYDEEFVNFFSKK